MRRFWLFGANGHARPVRNYFVSALFVIGVALTVSALVEVYFRYLDRWEHFGEVQTQIAAGAAFKIEQFVQEIERDMRAATRNRELVQDGLTEEYRWELRRLLVNTPAIVRVTAFDLAGAQRAQARKHGHIAVGAQPPIRRDGETFFAPTGFTEEGPSMTIAVPIERFAGERIGTLQAQVDLKHVWEAIRGIKVGKAGKAYLVTRLGNLLAHPDITLVLQKRNLGQIPHVKAAFNNAHRGVGPKAVVADNFMGKRVYTTNAIVPRLNWGVFTEQPIEEVYAPLYGSLVRTSVVLVLGIGVALVTTLFVRRRVVRPVEILRQAVDNVRKGDFSTRVNLKTGDDFEVLSEDFYQMAADLKEAYTDLEHKVAERTQELRAANMKLEDASKHKSQFLANVNHELRTPLGAIIGYARLIQRETEGEISDLQKENLEDLLQNAERLLGMINGLLDLSKIEAGRMEVRKQPVNIGELLEWAIATVTPMLNYERVRLVREIPPSLRVLDSDPDMLRQVILNLLANAAKFTDEGEIRVFARQRDGALDLGISDTGIGIAPEEVGNIFEEFRRGASSRNREQAGTGLGLAIVKRFVALLGGDIAVESELGRGSTFTVTLPIDNAENVRV